MPYQTTEFVQEDHSSRRRPNLWSPGWRGVAFALAASSILCLLADFYRVCSMRGFTLYVFVPCMMVLAALALFDFSKATGQLGRAVVLGLIGGLCAAVAYDLFRLPFVFAKEWHLTPFVPALALFKVFPRFGAMILGQSMEQGAYSLGAQVTGWAYHFSNGATFGIMYLALVGKVENRHWGWAVLMAIALEAGMLLTPYPRIFQIPITTHFIAVTLSAHAIFGVILGVSAKRLALVVRLGT